MNFSPKHNQASDWLRAEGTERCSNWRHLPVSPIMQGPLLSCVFLLCSSSNTQIAPCISTSPSQFGTPSNQLFSTCLPVRAWSWNSGSWPESGLSNVAVFGLCTHQTAAQSAPEMRNLLRNMQARRRSMAEGWEETISERLLDKISSMLEWATPGLTMKKMGRIHDELAGAWETSPLHNVWDWVLLWTHVMIYSWICLLRTLQHITIPDWTDFSCS